MSHKPLTRDLAHNPGMRLDRDAGDLLGWLSSAQPTELHQPGPYQKAFRMGPKYILHVKQGLRKKIRKFWDPEMTPLCMLLKKAEITGSERCRRLSVSWLRCGNFSADTRCGSLLLRTSLTLRFHLGKSLLKLWTPLTQSFRGSEILGAVSSNHCCLISQASKRDYKLLPMCGVCVFTSQRINVKTVYSPFIWKDNFSKISWPGMDLPPLRPMSSASRSFYSQQGRCPRWAPCTLTLCRRPSLNGDLTIVCLGHFRHKCY